MISLLAAIATALGVLGVLDLLQGRGKGLDEFVRRAVDLRVHWRGEQKALGEILDSLGTDRRLRRSGLQGELPHSRLMLLKALLAVIGLAVGVSIFISSSGRLTGVASLTLPLAGFLLPDVVLELIGRRRLRAVERAMSDALDLAANGVGTGQDPISALAAASFEDAPLGREFRALEAARKCGATRREVLAEMRDRVPTYEISNLAAMVERSSRFGSPVAERLRELARDTRRSHMRGIAERAARSSPRIQLVVALLLVPSVLLMIAAGLLANLGSFMSGL